MINRSPNFFIAFCYVVLTVGILAFPHFAGRYILHVAIITGIWIILGSSLNIIYGYLGGHSFGHAAFYAIGAYTSTLLTMNWHLSFWVALPIAALMAALFGYLIGWPCVRLKGASFAIVTLGFGEIVKMILMNQEGLSGGSSGITGIPFPSALNIPFLMEITFDSKIAYYYLIVFFVILTLIIIKRMINSPIGMALLAVRENEPFAQSLGVNAMKYKTLGFAVSTFFAGIAGSLFAHYTHFISPYSFTVNESFDMAIMVVFGGAGTIIGPVMGAIILTILPDLLQTLQEFRLVFYGAILVFVIMFFPKGLAGMLSLVKIRFQECRIKRS